MLQHVQIMSEARSETGDGVRSFTREVMVTGYHIYNSIWEEYIGTLYIKPLFHTIASAIASFNSFH